MKKLINQPSAVVREMLEGLARLAPDSALVGDENVLVRRVAADAAERPVALVSGGGSGHEPAHAGYVGAGMLSAAVCGEVFTSPSTDAVLAAIRATAGPAGALLIVKNYTGDRLNFGLAAELARAEGIPVDVVLVADDVSLSAHVPRDRRRGIAGTVFVHKIAGAAASSGWPLDRVAAIARAAAARIGSMGVALGGCTLPGVETSGFSLADDEIELGLGIHGEKGVERVAPLPADELADMLIDRILLDLGVGVGVGVERGHRDGPVPRVALLVNGLGGTPPMELAIMLRAAHARLLRRGVSVERAWAGTFLSALDMPGCSISILVLDDETLALLDAPTDAPAWPRLGQVNDAIRMAPPAAAGDAAWPPLSAPGRAWSMRLQPAVHAVAQALLDHAPELAALDAVAGDGDLGASMTRAAHAILDLPDEALGSPSDGLAALGSALRKAIGGSSGPFYATALMRAARTLGGAANGGDADPPDWARAFIDAVDAVAELGGAKAGDRTMLDALLPAARTFDTALREGQGTAEAFGLAVAAAEHGARDTAGMVPRAGRASYLGERALGAPDAGAVAVTCWLRALRPHVR